MEVEIRIKIKPENPDSFNEDELISDLQWQFTDITGYEIKEIEIESYD